MAVTKVSKVDNILQIEITDGDTSYRNASWYEIARFTDSSVVLIYQGGVGVRYVEIAFSDFQDGAGTPINTESTIVAYLAPLVG